MQKISENNCLHSLGYHIIWCPKFRHCVLKDEVALELRHIISQVCVEREWIIHALEIMPDHIHLFVQANHLTAPVEISKTIKSISAVHIFASFPTLKGRKFWGSGLWSKGTFYSTVGSVSEDAIRLYIETQYDRKYRNS